MALRDVMDHAVKAEKEYKKKVTVRHTNVRLAAMTLSTIPLLAFSVYSWVAKPAFIWGQPVVEQPVEQDANLRMAMFLLGMRIDAYRESEGLWPGALSDLGETVPGVTYELVSDSVFELRGLVAGSVVIFRSDQPAEEFLGNTRDVISTRRKR